MTKSQINFLILIFLLIGCSQKETTELNGVWFNVDPTERENYYEAHITDTGFVVVNQKGLSYLSSYVYKSDSLIQYLRDPVNNRNIIDTLRFKIERHKDSFKMVNLLNEKASSNWTKIPNLKPFEFHKNQSVDSFALGLRERYFDNYVSKFVPENYVDLTMDNFEIDWNIKQKYNLPEY